VEDGWRMVEVVTPVGHTSTTLHRPRPSSTNLPLTGNPSAF
jgi:hypothetical protein